MATSPSTSSRVSYGADGSTRIMFVIDVPGNLTNHRIDQAVVMLAARAKYILGQRYR